MNDKLPPEVAEAIDTFATYFSEMPGVQFRTEWTWVHAHLHRLTDENARLQKLCEDFTFADNAALRRSNERVEKAEAERDALRRLLCECAPIIHAQAGAEHMLDGFGPSSLRPTDDLVERVALVVVEDGE